MIPRMSIYQIIILTICSLFSVYCIDTPLGRKDTTGTIRSVTSSRFSGYSLTSQETDLTVATSVDNMHSRSNSIKSILDYIHDQDRNEYFSTDYNPADGRSHQTLQTLEPRTYVPPSYQYSPPQQRTKPRRRGESFTSLNVPALPTLVETSPRVAEFPSEQQLNSSAGLDRIADTQRTAAATRSQSIHPAPLNIVKIQDKRQTLMRSQSDFVPKEKILPDPRAHQFSQREDITSTESVRKPFEGDFKKQGSSHVPRFTEDQYDHQPEQTATPQQHNRVETGRNMEGSRSGSFSSIKSSTANPEVGVPQLKQGGFSTKEAYYRWYNGQNYLAATPPREVHPALRQPTPEQHRPYNEEEPVSKFSSSSDDGEPARKGRGLFSFRKDRSQSKRRQRSQTPRRKDPSEMVRGTQPECGTGSQSSSLPVCPPKTKKRTLLQTSKSEETQYQLKLPPKAVAITDDERTPAQADFAIPGSARMFHGPSTARTMAFINPVRGNENTVAIPDPPRPPVVKATPIRALRRQENRTPYPEDILVPPNDPADDDVEHNTPLLPDFNAAKDKLRFMPSPAKTVTFRDTTSIVMPDMDAESIRKLRREAQEKQNASPKQESPEPPREPTIRKHKRSVSYSLFPNTVGSSSEKDIQVGMPYVGYLGSSISPSEQPTSAWDAHPTKIDLATENSYDFTTAESEFRSQPRKLQPAYAASPSEQYTHIAPIGNHFQNNLRQPDIESGFSLIPPDLPYENEVRSIRALRRQETQDREDYGPPIVEPKTHLVSIRNLRSNTREDRASPSFHASSAPTYDAVMAKEMKAPPMKGPWTPPSYENNSFKKGKDIDASNSGRVSPWSSDDPRDRYLLMSGSNTLPTPPREQDKPIASIRKHPQSILKRPVADPDHDYNQIEPPYVDENKSVQSRFKDDGLTQPDNVMSPPGVNPISTIHNVKRPAPLQAEFSAASLKSRYSVPSSADSVSFRDGLGTDPYIESRSPSRLREEVQDDRDPSLESGLKGAFRRGVRKVRSSTSLRSFKSPEKEDQPPVPPLPSQFASPYTPFTLPALPDFDDHSLTTGLEDWLVPTKQSDAEATKRSTRATRNDVQRCYPPNFRGPRNANPPDYHLLTKVFADQRSQDVARTEPGPPILFEKMSEEPRSPPVGKGLKSKTRSIAELRSALKTAIDDIGMAPARRFRK